MSEAILTHGLEWGAALCSILAVFLTAQRKLSGYPVALLACLLYSRVFVQARLYADALLQGIFCLGLLYGWLVWWHDREKYTSQPARHGSDNNPFFIRKLQTKALWWGVGLASLFGIFWGIILYSCTDDAAPFLDAGLSSISLLGQYWTARRYRENWLLWIGADFFYMLLFIQRALYPTSLLYAGFIALAFYGYKSWGRADPPIWQKTNQSDTNKGD